MALDRLYRAILTRTEAFTAPGLIVQIDDDPKMVLASNGDGSYGAGENVTESNPIGIYRGDDKNIMALHANRYSQGDHRVLIQEDVSSVETTECFKKAVQSVSSMMLVYRPVPDTIEGATWNEAYNALESNVMLFLNYEGDFIPCTTYTDTFIAFDQILADSTGVTNFRVQWHYDGTVTTSKVTYPSQS